MAQSVGKINLDLGVNKAGFQRDLNGLKSTAIGLGKVLAGAFAVAKLVEFGKKAMKLGSDLSEVQNVVDVTFPKMTKQVDDFAKNAAASFGLSETMAKRYTGTFGAMAKAFGFSEKQAYNMSTTLTGLAGDVASFYNLSQDEAYTKLKSVFTGETESLKDLGVVMTQTALDAYAMSNGFSKTTSAMSETEKVALRFAFVTDQLALASGDFSRTSGSWANQMKLLQLQFESFMATVGQGLINLFTPVIKVINFLLGKLMTVGNAFKAFTELLTGRKASEGSGISESANDVADMQESLNGATGGANDLGKATKGAGDAAKKVAKDMKALMGFDQINKLSDVSDSGSGGGSGNGGGPGGSGSLSIKGGKVDMGQLAEGENRLSGLLDFWNTLSSKFSQGFNLTFRADGINQLINSLKGIEQSVYDIFSDGKIAEASAVFLQKLAYALGQITGSIGNVVLGVAIYIAESFNKALFSMKLDIKEWIVRQMNIQGDIVQALGNIVGDLSNGLYNAITSESYTNIGSYIIQSIYYGLMGAQDILNKALRDIIKGLEKIVSDNVSSFSNALIGMSKSIEPIFKGLKEVIEYTFSVFNKLYDSSVGPFVNLFMEGISDLVGVFIAAWDKYINPVLSGISTKFFEVIETSVKPMIDSFSGAISSLIDVLTVLWINILQPILAFLIDNFVAGLSANLSALGETFNSLLKVVAGALDGIFQSIKGLLDFIVGVFTGDWEKAWSGIVDIVSGVWKTITSIFSWDTVSAFFNGVWSVIMGVFSVVDKWFFGMFTAAWGFIVKAFQGAVSWFGGMWNGIMNVFSGVSSFFGNIFKGAWNTITGIFSAIPNWFKNIFSVAWAGVRDVFSTGGRIFAGIVDGIAGTFKNVVNAIISGINGVIAVPFNAINGALDGIRGVNIMGFAPFSWLPSIGVPRIPMLAQGGFVKANTPQLAMIGDNKHYGEIVAPENKMLDMARKAAELSGGGNNIELLAVLREILYAIKSLDLTIDGDSITRKIIDKINDIAIKTGESPILV